MAADIVPVRLGLTNGDLYTLWAPRWRDAGDEWEALLGKDEDLFAFASVADLVAFVRTNSDNDLTDHPAWEKLTKANAHRLSPDEDHLYDLIEVPGLVAEKPNEDSVESVHRALAIVSAIGSVCDLPVITKMFNGNPRARHHRRRHGRLRRSRRPQALDRDRGRHRAVLAVGHRHHRRTGHHTGRRRGGRREGAERARRTRPPELDEDALTVDDEDDLVIEGEVDTDEESDALEAEAQRQVLGSDEDFWTEVGIDPVRIMTSSGTLYTLRCYVGDEPKFLGRNGRISVFNSERALARYLADEHESDLSGYSSYEIIRTAATDGSLRVDVTDDNIYVLSGLADDIADGPDAVDRDQLDLAVEFLRDVGDYAEESIVSKRLDSKEPLGALVSYLIEPGSVAKPSGPYAKAVEQWEELESFVESRLRQE